MKHCFTYAEETSCADLRNCLQVLYQNLFIIIFQKCLENYFTLV